MEETNDYRDEEFDAPAALTRSESIDRLREIASVGCVLCEEMPEDD